MFSRAVALAEPRLTLPDGGRLVVAVAKVPDHSRDLYRQFTDYPLVDGGYRALCRAGHAGLIASGTATLEAALLVCRTCLRIKQIRYLDDWCVI